MAKEPFIHVIIPTGGREETIWSTLKSCVSQSYEKLIIWVCDNSFQPETKLIVEAIGDKRIRLIKPQKRLCMSENWEFALSHIVDGYCTIIGDDDSLMPESIVHVARLIESNPEIKVINHLPASYYWPNYIGHDRASTLDIRPMNFNEYIQEVRPILSDVCAFKTWYGHLPVLYHGFISVDHIVKIKMRSSLPFFNFCAPDIYAAIVLAMHTDYFLMVNTALTVGGQSARSNGANYSVQTKLGKQFTAELPSNLRFRYESMSISLAVYEALENAFQAYPEVARNLKINMDRLLQVAVAESLGMSQNHQDQIRQKLGLIYQEDVLHNALNREREIKAQPPLGSALRLSPMRLIGSKLKYLKDLMIGTMMSSCKKLRNSEDQENLSDASQRLGGFCMVDGCLKLGSPINLSPYGINCVHTASQFLQDKIDLFRKN